MGTMYQARDVESARPQSLVATLWMSFPVWCLYLGALTLFTATLARDP